MIYHVNLNCIFIYLSSIGAFLEQPYFILDGDDFEYKSEKEDAIVENRIDSRSVFAAMGSSNLVWKSTKREIAVVWNDRVLESKAKTTHVEEIKGLSIISTQCKFLPYSS